MHDSKPNQVSVENLNESVQNSLKERIKFTLNTIKFTETHNQIRTITLKFT